MGEFYSFRCPVCDRPKDTEPSPDVPVFEFGIPDGIPLGCGLNYPYVCKSIYEDIRAGKLGPEAKKKLPWLAKPGIFHQRVVFVCGHCGKWDIHDDIRICLPKKGRSHPQGSSLDRQRETAAGSRLRPMCYIDPKIYDVVWEAEYPCERCGGRTHPLPGPKDLNCNRCGSPLEITMTGCWD